MHPYTKFGILTSKNIGDMHQTQSQFYKLGQRSRSRSQWPINGTWHSTILRCAYTPNLGFLSQKRHAPDMIILKTRSEVKVKVTWKWYVTLCHPKMHSHTKFGIPTPKNIGDMHQTQCQFIGQGQSDPRMVCDTFHLKMHVHTKFGICTSNDMKDMLY